MSEVKKTVTVLTQATKGIEKVSKELMKIMENVSTLSQTAEEMTDTIALKQSQLDEIDAKKSDELRIAKAHLEIEILENEGDVLDGLLRKRDLAEISELDLDTLVDDLAVAKRDNTEAVNTAVAIATKAQSTEHEAKVIELESAHRVDVAEKDASITSLQSQITFLEKNIETLEDNAKLERQARIKIAEAESKKGAVIVNNGK